METDLLLSQKMRRLAHISIFKGIDTDREALKEFARLFSLRKFSRGQKVISEGEDGNELYIINKGTVEIEKQTRQNDTYTVVELRAEDNVFFGEIGVLDPDKRSATVTSKTDCEFLVLSRDDFIQFGDNHPAVGLTITREISRILCHRIRKANTDIITLFDALVDEMAESEGLSEGDTAE